MFEEAARAKMREKCTRIENGCVLLYYGKKQK